MTRSPALLLLLLAACHGAPPDSADTDSADTDSADTAVGTAALRVHVAGTDGAPLAGARISAGGREATTDAAGEARLEGMPTGVELVVVASLDGHAPGAERVRLEGDGLAALVLAPTERHAIAEADLGGVINVGAIRLTFPPGAIVDTGGAPVSGSVDVEILVLDPTVLGAAPGAMVSIDDEGFPFPLRATAAFHAHLSQGGAALQVSAPVGLSIAADAAPDLALYGFDELSGYWKGESPEVQEASDGLTVEVPHFSWWAVGALIDAGDRHCLGGRVVDPTGAALPGAVVSATGTGALVASSATAGDDGRFCLDVPQGLELALSTMAVGASGELVAWQGRALVPSAVASCALGGCTELGDLGATADDRDDDGDGYTVLGGDCDDLDGEVHPGAEEICDDKDNDCDGTTTDEPFGSWYPDVDGDGLGDPSAPITDCEAPDGYVDNDDDTDDMYHCVPKGDEVCNGVDDDCDGTVDEDAGKLWYRDLDKDGLGDPTTGVTACDAPPGYVDNGKDADDGAACVPTAEVCDEVDNDCDGDIDEDAPALPWYLDGDGDGFGDPTQELRACKMPTGYSDKAADCDDTDASISPGSPEVCGNLKDDDCDLTIDDGC